jgi:hypothetical protein
MDAPALVLLSTVCLAGSALAADAPVAVPASASSASGASVASATRRSPVLVTGLPSLVEYPRTLTGLISHSEDPVCIQFSVRSLDSATPRLGLTSTGIAGARLIDLGAIAPGLDCVQSQARAATTIWLTDVADTERPIRMVLPVAAFPGAAAGAKGKLLVLIAASAPVEVPMTVQREDFAPFVKAFLWFLGVAVPAVLAAGIGLAVYRAQKHIDSKSAETEALEAFRRDEAAALKSFFDGVYQTTMALKEDDAYRGTMERELGARRMMSVLPRKARERLLVALRGRERAKLAGELAKTFPDHRASILKPFAK